MSSRLSEPWRRAARTWFQTLAGAVAAGELVADRDLVERVVAALVAATIAAGVAFFMNQE